MVDVISLLKTNARILHRQAIYGQGDALKRVYRHYLTGHMPDLENNLKRRHCLSIVAREIGFRGWGHALGVIEGKDSADFGTLLSPARCHAHWNIWFASYDEAKLVHMEQGGYLLAYKNQYLIVDVHFITTLGLQPTDEDWHKIGYDWVRPKNLDARKRLYAKLVKYIIGGSSDHEREDA